MGLFTYNFVGVSSPAAAASHKGFVGDSATAEIPTPPDGTEGTQANYDAIEADDASRWENNLILAGSYPYKMFRWYIPPSVGLPSKLTPTHNGWVPGAGSPGASGFYLKAYNLDTGAWTLVDTSGADLNADDTLTGILGPGVSAYFDATNRYIWTGVINVMPHTAFLSRRYDDYTELVVETVEGSRNIYRNVNGLINGLMEPGCQI